DSLAGLLSGRFQFHSAHTIGAAAHRTNLVLFETNGLPFAGGEHDLLFAVRETDPDERIAIFEVDRDNAAGPDIVEFIQFSLLHLAAPGGEEDVFALRILGHR